MATALIDTGSRMDEVIFEEFKGTGNLEIHLDRKLDRSPRLPVDRHSEERNPQRRTADSEGRSQPRLVLRKVLTPLSPVEAMELLLSKMAKTKTNQDFLSSMSNGKG